MKKYIIAAVLLGLLSLGLAGCLAPDTDTDQLVISVTPNAGYAPLEVTVIAKGPEGGIYTLDFKGTSVTQANNVFTIRATKRDHTGTVTWHDGDKEQSVKFNVNIKDPPKATQTILLNGLSDLWTIHPRSRYIVSVPFLSHSGWHIIDAHVKVWRKSAEDTIYCPPYSGAGVYHATSPVNNSIIPNAFVFHSTWTGNTDGAVNVYPQWGENHTYAKGDRVNWDNKAYECKVNDTVGITPSHANKWKVIGDIHYGTGLPFSPPGYGESGYPGYGINCEPGWDKHSHPASTTTITITFENVKGETLANSWDIPTMPDPGCSTY